MGGRLRSARGLLPRFAMTLAAALVAAVLLTQSPHARAATLAPICVEGAGNVAELIAAIDNANANSQDDTIVLTAGCAYNLTDPDNSTDGTNGLPSILSDRGHTLTIVGNGATIRRASSAPEFRIFHVAAGATLSVRDLSLADGIEPNGGGALYSHGTTSLFFVTLRNNSAGAANGGALYAESGSVTIDFGLLTGNSAANGGALYNDGSQLTLTNSMLGGNTASQQGGALAGSGTVTVRTSTFAGNSASLNAGAVWVENGNWSIENATFTSNSTGGQGGGLANESSSPSVNNSTFADNTADNGGASLANLGSGILTFGNTILHHTTSVAECVGAVSPEANSVVSDDSCGVGLIIADPLLGPLQDNGGPILTRALLPGSPALDQGDDLTCVSTDQRGVPRPQGAACDIGAYEVADMQTGPVFTVTNSSDSTAPCVPLSCSLRAAITAANATPNGSGPDTIAFAIPGAGVRTIAPDHALPQISEAVTIDGYTQPGASPNTLAVGDDAVILIELDGTNAGERVVARADSRWEHDPRVGDRPLWQRRQHQQRRKRHLALCRSQR
jgi:predicted outer membrane repeat protein